jgi:hypothetical protein
VLLQFLLLQSVVVVQAHLSILAVLVLVEALVGKIIFL